MGRRRPEKHPASVSALLKLVAGDNPVAAEVGVFRGQTSAVLLRDHPTLFLYMIDPWAPFSHDGTYAATGDYMALQDQATCDANYAEAMRVTEFAYARRIVKRLTSELVAPHISDGGLDLAFIDAEHSYEACQYDISLWWPKIKPGGILCGHDYSRKVYPGVVQAVNEAAVRLRVQLQFAAGWVWWFKKD